MSRQAAQCIRQQIPSGFTIGELLVVLAILAGLAAILIPVSSRMQRMAWMAESTSNMRQLHTLLMNFVGEQDGRLPGVWQNYDSSDPGGRGKSWWRNIEGATDGTSADGIFKFQGGFPTSMYDKALRRQYPEVQSVTYAMNTFGTDQYPARLRMMPLVRISRPSQTVLLSLAGPLLWNPTVFGYGNGNSLDGWPSRPYNNKSLICFVDGHIEVIGSNPDRKSGLDLPDEAWRP